MRELYPLLFHKCLELMGEDSFIELGRSLAANFRRELTAVECTQCQCEVACRLCRHEHAVYTRLHDFGSAASAIGNHGLARAERFYHHDAEVFFSREEQRAAPGDLRDQLLLGQPTKDLYVRRRSACNLVAEGTVADDAQRNLGSLGGRDC